VGGSSVDAHLRQAALTEGVEVEELYELSSELPIELSYLWDLYNNLHVSRQSGFGPCALSYSDMWCYFQLVRQTVEAWEVVVLKQVDMIYLEVVSTSHKKTQEVQDN
jgi:hypothetical protein